MSPVRSICTRAVTLALLSSHLFADTIILKSGERIEGQVIKETAKDLTIAVAISASIKDERVVTRAEIDRIEKIAADTIAYKAIATIQTPPNSLSASQYDPLLRPLQAFLKQYPNSMHAKDVKTAVTEISAEKQRVEGGEIKFGGQWLSKEEADREKVQIGGRLALQHMKNQSASGDLIGALNTFAIMEKSYVGAASLPDGIEFATQLLSSLKATVERAEPDQKAFQAEKERGFASGSPADRASMMAAYKSEVAQADAAVLAADATGQWPPFIPTNDKSLKALRTRIERETTRLSRLPADKMRASVQMTNAARQKIAAGETEEANTMLKEAVKLWAVNEAALRLSKELSAKPKAEPVPVPAATPAPASTPAKTVPAKKPSAAIQPAVPSAPSPVEPVPFYRTLSGQIGIIVTMAAGFTGVNIFQKMKARRAEG